MKYKALLILLFSLSTSCLFGQFTKADTLRGSITPERAWWDLTHYHLDIEVSPSDSTLSGSNEITYLVLDSRTTLQIDLQEPLHIDRIEQDGKELNYESIGDAHFVSLKKEQEKGTLQKIKVFYSGRPHIAIRAPWDGGISWKYDDNGMPFVASSCQGIGASVWWPCKDHMYDEPDSMNISVTTPDNLMDISNGKLIGTEVRKKGTKTFHWSVKNPINNYGVNLSVGDYVHFGETYKGLNGDLSLDYYVLRDNIDQAKQQFKEVPLMMDAFEHWFGPYPFYKDGFKLIEVPYLGMEHQSAVTYGNGYQNGYLGRDLSQSGWGLKFDFIIIHEAGHEWFANNITYKDIADMWIHESFTAYSECLYLEFHHGKEAGAEYVIGTRRNINNDSPIIGKYGVNNRGSGDMYYKGSNMLHTLRQIVNDDEKWRALLTDLNKEFYHRTVTTKEVENFMSVELEINLEPFFNQYLRTTKIPILEYFVDNQMLFYRWSNVVEGFVFPVNVKVGEQSRRLKASRFWKSMPVSSGAIDLQMDPNFYAATMQTLGN